VRTTGPLLLVLAFAALGVGCGQAPGQNELDALLEHGWRAYSTGDFDVAIHDFTDVADAPTAETAHRYSALLGLATTHHLRTNPDLTRARAAYTRLAELDTDDARRQSLLGLARIDIAEGHDGDGQTRLTALITDFPDSREADEAAIHLAASLLAPAPSPDAPAGFVPAREGRADRGAGVLEKRLQSHPHNPLATAMHMMLADHYMARGEMRVAVGHLVAGEEEGIAGVKTHSIVLWQIARIAENALKDYGLAEHYYERYTREFKRSALYYRALKSLERVRALKAEQGA